MKLGVGKNMVTAIRYWGLAFKILEQVANPDRPRVPLTIPSAFGTTLLGDEGWDPYLEDAASLWLLHWKLLSAPCQAPVWWVAFNDFTPIQFSESQLTTHVLELAAAAGWPAVVEASVKKDVDCLLRTYTVRRHGRQGLDDILDCPFRELGLIESAVGEEGRSWRFVVGEKPGLPDEIVAYCALDFASRSGEGARSISIARLAHDPGSPGAAFRLTETALVRRAVPRGWLQRLASSSGTWRTASASAQRRPGNASGQSARRLLRPVVRNGGDRRMSTTPQLLNTQVKVRQHHLRSAHLEHHEGQRVGAYIPTGRALEVVHRITRAMRSSDAGRAWSLTGPYGAGKSSFALFVHALLGPDGDEARTSAEAALRAAEPELLSLIEDGRRTFGATSRGFIRAAATAQREPVNDTVFRAFSAGAYGYWRARMPADVKNALYAADRDRTPRALGLVLEALCAHAPVLIEIDEFGKNLEHFAGDAAEADLFVLQELAERCAGDHGLPALLITLQHMAFDDYVRAASALQRREWGKVQGRFEDISFVESSEQSLRLVAGAFEPPASNSAFGSALRRLGHDRNKGLASG